MTLTIASPGVAPGLRPARRYYLKTFGCQMNVADSAGFADVLEGRGFEPTGDPADADLVVVNTCTVREKAEDKAMTYLGQVEALARRRRKHQDALKVALVGCLTNQVEAFIRERFPSIVLTLRPEEMDSFDARVAAVFPDAHRIELAPEHAHEAAYLAELTGKESQANLLHGTYARTDRHRFVNVMRGCEKMCTFCIVPFARGANFSYPIDHVRAQVERAVALEGAKVITLLGQSILDYGKDRPVREGLTPIKRGDAHFRDLLTDLATCFPAIWFKFLTSHPHDLTRETIDAIAELPNVSRYFHLPLQAGDNVVLRRMARRYSVEQYVDTVGYLRERIPEARLSTDLIVGFVGETEAQFQRTIEACERIRFEKAYTFYYTQRPGTYADDNWPDTLTEDEKKERLGRLIEVTNHITLEVHRAMAGQVLEVLVEGPSDRDPGMVIGRSREEDVVLFPGEATELTGLIVPVRVTQGALRTLRGELVEQPRESSPFLAPHHARR